MLAPIYASVEGAGRYAGRFPWHAANAFYRSVPSLATNARRAIQFTRSTPGISVALAGMSRREHVLENLGVASAAPLTPSEYRRLYQ